MHSIFVDLLFFRARPEPVEGLFSSAQILQTNFAKASLVTASSTVGCLLLSLSKHQDERGKYDQK